MNQEREFIMVDGERRPCHKPSDGYLMAEVWSSGPGSTDGGVRFICDSHYGLGFLYEAIQQVAESKRREPFTLDLLATKALTELVESDPGAKDVIPTLAKHLRIYPSSKSNLFSLEYDNQHGLELYLGAKHAESFGYDLSLCLDDYPSDHKFWIGGYGSKMVDPPQKENALFSLIELFTTWPGLDKDAAEAIQYVRKRWSNGSPDTTLRDPLIFFTKSLIIGILRIMVRSYENNPDPTFPYPLFCQ